MQGKLKVFKRRAAGYQEAGVTHHAEKLRLLFAPGSGWSDGRFEVCRLDLATWNNATFTEMFFEGNGMLGANFRGAVFDRCTFSGCDLTGASFEGARLQATGFGRCNLEGTSFAGASLLRPVSFVDCDLTNADLRFYESDSGQPNFVRSDLRGASFSVNCEFWNGTFDERAVADFGRVFARASKDEALIEMVKARWGSAEYDAVDGYMRRD